MIKMAIDLEIRKVLIFGLSEKNLSLLSKGKPIHFHADELGLNDYDIIILAGKDEQTMEKKIRETFKIR